MKRNALLAFFFLQEKKTMRGFFSLSSVNLVQNVSLLIVLPYIARIITLEQFGKIFFAQAVIQYFSLLIDYGFPFTMARDVARVRNEQRTLNETVTNVFLIRIALAAICFVVLITICSTIEIFRQDAWLFYSTFGIVLGVAISSEATLQGLEKMHVIFYATLFARIGSLATIFFFLHSHEDYLVIPIAFSAQQIIASCIMLIFLLWKMRVRFHPVRFTVFRSTLQSQSRIFLSSAMLSVYSLNNTFFLRLFASERVVGIYAAGEKVLKATLALIGNLSQSFYPVIAVKTREAKTEAIAMIRILLRRFLLIGFVISASLFILADLIVAWMYGSAFQEAGTVIRILSFIPFLLAGSSVFSNLYLLGFDYQRAWSRVIFSASAVGIVLLFALVAYLQWEYVGVSVAYLTSEAVIFILSGSIFWRKMHYADR